MIAAGSSTASLLPQRTSRECEPSRTVCSRLVNHEPGACVGARLPMRAARAPDPRGGTTSSRVVGEQCSSSPSSPPLKSRPHARLASDVKPELMAPRPARPGAPELRL